MKVEEIVEHTGAAVATVKKLTRDVSRIKASPPCPGCGSEDSQRNGTEKKGKVQRYRCKACGMTYQDNYIYEKGYGQSE